jgi:hypothetical protein
MRWLANGSRTRYLEVAIRREGKVAVARVWPSVSFVSHDCYSFGPAYAHQSHGCLGLWTRDSVAIWMEL